MMENAVSERILELTSVQKYEMTSKPIKEVAYAVGKGFGSSSSVIIAFENLELTGQEFMLTGEKVSGTLNGIAADFVINQASGLTWANDLAVLFATTPNLNELNYDTILFQIGGTISYASQRLDWGMGSSSAPGTRVFIDQTFDNPIQYEDIYVWIGNAWVESGVSSWTGFIQLNGLSSTVPFITQATPAEGSLNSGESVEINLSLDTNELIAGAFRDVIVITSNDPLTPINEFEVSLKVLGTPILSVTPEILDFGVVFTSATYNGNIIVTNTGTDVLEIESLSFDGDFYISYDFESESLIPGLSTSIMISFDAESVGVFEGSMSFNSNAENTPTVQLRAQAVNPGILSVDIPEFNVELSQDEMTLRTIRLTNSGESDLLFTASTMRLTNANTLLDDGSSLHGLKIKNEIPSKLATVFPGTKMISNPSSSLLNESDLEVLWYQPVSTSNAIISTQYAALGAGVYTTDDFFISDGALLDVITMYGSRFSNEFRLDEVATGFTFFIYPDANGKPAGNPDDGSNAHIFKFEAEFNAEGLSVSEFSNETIYQGFAKLDIIAATGESLFLPSGRYWLVTHLNSNGSVDFNHSWYSFSGVHPSSDAQVIDTSNYFGLGFEEWSLLSSFIPADNANLAFKLEGTSVNFLSTSPSQGSIPPSEFVDIELLFDAANLQPGEYELTLRLSTNSTVTPLIEIPVTLVVTEGGNGLLWANLHYPSVIEIEQGDNFTVHGLVIPAVDLSNWDSDALKMWVGFHTENIHPALWEQEAWVLGNFHQSHDDILEYIVQTGSNLSMGQYYFATRYQFADHNFMYGGFHEAGGGFWNPLFHQSGKLTVLQSTTIEDQNDIPTSFSLSQNYPNPFNPTTTIKYDLPEASDVRLDVFNIQGQRVASLVNAFQSAGIYSISFDASNLSSGVYLYRLQAGSFNMVRKMTLVK